MPEMPIGTCPVCGYTFDYATCVSLASSAKYLKPETGDITLCVKCGEVMVFLEGGTVRQADIKDVIKMDAPMSRALDTTQRMIREKRPLG